VNAAKLIRFLLLLLVLQSVKSQNLKALFSEVNGVVRQIIVSLHLQDFFLFGASSSVWDCRLIRRPAKDARRRHEPSSAGLQAKAFGHQKMALESTLPPHNDL
jgi:hypothetical protein